VAIFLYLRGIFLNIILTQTGFVGMLLVFHIVDDVIYFIIGKAVNLLTDILCVQVSEFCRCSAKEYCFGPAFFDNFCKSAWLNRHYKEGDFEGKVRIFGFFAP